jgi:hypothetical protein
VGVSCSFVADQQPGLVVQVVAHSLVALGVALVVSRIPPRRAALGVAILGVVGHGLLDEPVANGLARLVKRPSLEA